MPPKPASQQPKKPQGPSKQELEAIQSYLSQKPDFEKLIAEAKQNPQPASIARREETEYDRKTREAVDHIRSERRKKSLADGNQVAIAMPVHPKEEETGGNLTDQVAKESKDSTASSHPLHQAGEAAKATVDDHRANPGPVISESLGSQPIASKEESRKKAAEMNK